MLTYRNVTTKENFLANIEWANQSIKPINTQRKNVREWEINDGFGNTWAVLFNGNVGEFSISNSQTENPFIVYLYLSGDQFEIVKANDNGRNIQSKRLLKKYNNLTFVITFHQ